MCDAITILRSIHECACGRAYLFLCLPKRHAVSFLPLETSNNNIQTRIPPSSFSTTFRMFPYPKHSASPLNHSYAVAAPAVREFSLARFCAHIIFVYTWVFSHFGRLLREDLIPCAAVKCTAQCTAAVAAEVVPHDKELRWHRTYNMSHIVSVCSLACRAFHCSRMPHRVRHSIL